MPRKIVLLLLMMGLMLPSLPIHADEVTSPAELLPTNTLLYLEMHNPRTSFDTLTQLFALESMRDALAQLFASESVPWIGDRITAAVFMSDMLPAGVMIFEVRDEQALDALIGRRAWNDWHITEQDDIRMWQHQTVPVGFLRIPGYLVVGTGMDSVYQQLTQSTPALLSNRTFVTVRDTLAPEPVLWLYSGINESAMAIYVHEDAFSLEIARQGAVPDAVARPLSPDALQGVPIGAWFVDAGMNADIGLQHAAADIRSLLRIFAPLDENLNNLPVIFESAPRTLLGVDLDDDLIPLFNGGYAAYMIGTSADLSLNGALILAPQQNNNAVFTLTRISNRLSQTANLDIELTGRAQYTLHPPTESFPELVYGVQDKWIYAGTSEGVSLSLLTIESGQNINRDPRWRRVLESAPAGTQRVTYVNLRELIDVAQVRIGSDNTFIKDVFTYLQRFESLAAFSRQDANGIQLTRIVLRFN